MEVLAGCDDCGNAESGKLYADVDGRHLCVRCWRRAGHLWPRKIADPSLVAEKEGQTRARMTKRGGADKHLVQKGRT